MSARISLRLHQAATAPVCLVIAALAAGCVEREVSLAAPVPSVQSYDVVEASRPALDLIFVIDSSGSMEEEQQWLAEDFPRFIEVIDGAHPLGRPDLHLGVVSTDLGGPEGADARCTGNGDAGRFLTGGSACPGAQDAFFVDVDDGSGDRQVNYSGDLGSAFACAATLGTEGCGFEQPLEALRRALDNPANQGFLRDEALLAVVFLTDEDDCSLSDPSLMLGPECDDPFDPATCPLGPLSSFRCFEHGVECDQSDARSPGTKTGCRPRESSPYLADVGAIAAALREVRDPERIVVAAISGRVADAEVVAVEGAPHLSPSCQSLYGEAAPPYRLASFLERFANNRLESICADDLTPALQAIAGEIATRLPGPCLHGEVDLDPDTEGLQLECSVVDVTTKGGTDTETAVPRCDDSDSPSATPCWVAEIDQNECPSTPTHAAIRLIRASGDDPPLRRTEARCAERHD